MTLVLGIVGHPLDHSLSVPMHMSAIFTLGIDYVYMSFDILPENLSHAVAQFRKERIKGFNVTIPFKEDIMPYLDSIDEHAGKIGAVNTVNNENGRLKGYNTDGIGYVRSLGEQAGFDPRGKQVLMIGAGGAAKAVAFSLLEAGADKIIIANRTQERAEALHRHLCVYFPAASSQRIHLQDMNDLDHKKINLVINTTSLGMKGAGDIDMDLTGFGVDTVVSDIVYNPLETPFLKRAKHAGLKTHDGAGMLVYQGAESFKLWTGIQPPVDVMRQAVLRALQEHH
ncbi:MAG: shikimate dehydrogenase [Deltaproteobacteria bacterium]|nr:shikimate dehydrogenase [Deltaproteobacteria bacterium]